VQEGILTLKSCDSMISYTPGNSTTWMKTGVLVQRGICRYVPV
jgi:hypothetical protein